MRNMKILVLGRGGQVGWELRHRLACLGAVIGVDFPEVDFTAVDKAESETELAMAINGTAPGVLAEEAKRLGCVLVHYSTDYVFDGAKQEPYMETDAPHPMNVYGRSKLAGDEAIQRVGGEFVILRTSWVYGARCCDWRRKRRSYGLWTTRLVRRLRANVLRRRRRIFWRNCLRRRGAGSRGAAGSIT